jgi:hypothetical protein
MSDDLTAHAAREWRAERERQPSPKPDREAYARALWRDAQTADLRAHLRKLYPRLFAHEPDPPRGERPARAA